MESVTVNHVVELGEETWWLTAGALALWALCYLIGKAQK